LNASGLIQLNCRAVKLFGASCTSPYGPHIKHAFKFAPGKFSVRLVPEPHPYGACAKICSRQIFLPPATWPASTLKRILDFLQLLNGSC